MLLGVFFRFIVVKIDGMAMQNQGRSSDFKF